LIVLRAGIVIIAISALPHGLTLAYPIYANLPTFVIPISAGIAIIAGRMIRLPYTIVGIESALAFAI
jgi:hypothetical protein